LEILRIRKAWVKLDVGWSDIAKKGCSCFFSVKSKLRALKRAWGACWLLN